MDVTYTIGITFEIRTTLMQKYEDFRENGWSCYFNDPFFDGDAPKAKVISRFVKRTRVDDNGGVDVPKEVSFTHKKDIDWIEERLNHVIRYGKKDNDYMIYTLAGLQLYVDEIRKGGYTAGILSNQELGILIPKKK